MKKELEALLEKYSAMLTKLEQEKVDNRPIEGRVEVLSKGRTGYSYVYVRKDPITGKAVRKYASQDKRSIISALAQQAYQEKVCKLLKTRIPQIRSLVAHFEEDELERLYTDLHPGRQVLIQPIVPTQNQKLQEWKNKPYEGLAFKSQEAYFQTNQGEFVRSKSEKILADRFFALGIPYKYECPLITRNRTTIYPDFTFYDYHNDQELYWEHFGMMGDPAYARKAYQKLEEYAQRGIFLGYGLITTFEMSDKPLNLKYINQTIMHYLASLQEHGAQ